MYLRGSHFCRAVGYTLALLLLSVSELQAQETTQCFSIEFFYDSSVDEVEEIRAALAKFAEDRTGLLVRLRDTQSDEAVEKRLDQIAQHFRLKEVQLPAVYGMNHVVAGIESEEQLERRLSEILRLTAYVRNGCPHCRAAKEFLGKYGQRYPALEIVYKEVITDAAANREMQQVVSRYRRSAASLPVIHYCNDLTIGFDRESTTGRTVMQKLDYWSRACEAQKKR